MYLAKYPEQSRHSVIGSSYTTAATSVTSETATLLLPLQSLTVTASHSSWPRHYYWSHVNYNNLNSLDLNT